jgi:hypothetical protein
MVVRTSHYLKLTAKALKSTQELTPYLIRVQSGFLPESSLQNAQVLADSLQSALHELQAAIKNPTYQSPHSQDGPPIVPLK